MSKVHIYGGGTISYVRNHLALCAPAFGTTARRLKQLLSLEADLHLTKMADQKSRIVTNKDLQHHVEMVCQQKDSKVIIMNAALCDFDGFIGGHESGPHAPRIDSRNPMTPEIGLVQAPKVIDRIKKLRPDIMIVGFKTTTKASFEEQIKKARRMDVDLVLANDTVTRKNFIVPRDCPEVLLKRDDAIKAISYHVKQRLIDKSTKIKNIRHFENHTQYSILLGKTNGRVNAFNQACKVLEDEGIQGPYLDSKWNMFHQNIYLISVKKT